MNVMALLAIDSKILCSLVHSASLRILCRLRCSFRSGLGPAFSVRDLFLREERLGFFVETFQLSRIRRHAQGHVCVFEERNGSLLTGDLMAGFGTIVIDPPEGHMATYLDSLQRMQGLPVTALFPAHGPVMANAKARIQEYIDHRLDRERNILAAWRNGMREPASIVREVYKDVAPAMYGLAERNVVAHLEKLQEERRI